MGTRYHHLGDQLRASEHLTVIVVMGVAGAVCIGLGLLVAILLS